MLNHRLQKQTKQNVWEDFYINTQAPTEENELYKKYIYKNQIQPIKSINIGNNVYIYHTIFLNCYVLNSEGGAVAFSKEDGKLLIEFSIFSNCSSQTHSGAIFASNCNCVVNYVCGLGCYQTKTDGDNWGQFIRTDFINKRYSLNYVLYSSIGSTPETPYGHGALILEIFSINADNQQTKFRSQTILLPYFLYLMILILIQLHINHLVMIYMFHL